MIPGGLRLAATGVLVAGATLLAAATLLPIGGPVHTVDRDDVRLARARLREAEQRHGADALPVVEELSRLQALLQDGEEGIALARRALAITEAHLGPEDERTATRLEDLAWWLWLSRDYKEERSVVERALRIRERAQPPDQLKLAFDLHLLADICYVETDYGCALQLRERAAPLWERACGPRSDCVAVNLLRLARVEQQLGHRERVLDLTSRAVDIYEEILPVRDVHLRFQRSLNLLGRALLDTGDLDGAERVLQRARSIWQVSGESHRIDTAEVLRTLGRLADTRGDLPGAIALFRQVAEIRSAVLGPRHPLVGLTYTELGALERRNGELSAARASLARAQDLLEKNEQRARPTWAKLLMEQALLDGDEGRLGIALGEALDGERISRDHFRATVVGLSERDALDQARERIAGLGPAWFWGSELERRGALDDTAASRLLDEAIRSRALVLDTLASRQRTLALHHDEEIAKRVEVLRAASQQLAGELVEGSREGVAQAQAEADRAERALAERSRSYRDGLARGEPGLLEVRAALPPRSALVSYFRHENEGGAYVATVLLPGDAPPRVIPLGSAASIDQAVKLWRDLVSSDPRVGGEGSGERAYRASARRLAELIWDPVAPFLEDADRVLVVPDGALHDVSLATLVPSGGGYLVDADLSFHYLTAERDLVGGDETVGVASGLLAVGDPAYGTRFAPLPGSRLEVLDVAGRWGAPTTILLGRDAQESAFKDLAPSFGVLHVATHAFFRLREGSDESPLRVTGLALSGGADASDPDDGILTAEEVALLDLRAVRWAVLSGCATGRGALEPGEGVLGLRRAFQLAGVRTLIVSLWPIEDEATRHWMRALYTARRSGASTVDAVSAAVRAALQEQRRRGGTTHPYFWGGFVSIGDWR